MDNYNWLRWLNHVTTEAHTFTFEMDEAAKTIKLKPAGKVLQQGTNQSAENFNNMEEGILAANLMGAELALHMNHVLQAIGSLQGEYGEVTLKNTERYPFNNSKATIPLAVPRPGLAYGVTVLDASTASTRGGIGDIKVSDRLRNAFKLEYEGGADAVTIKYIVTGGKV